MQFTVNMKQNLTMQISYGRGWLFAMMMLVLHLSGTAEALSLDGQSIIAFKRSIRDGGGSLSTWIETDESPCPGFGTQGWSGVSCEGDLNTTENLRVTGISLPKYSLRGDLAVLAGALASLDRLRALGLGQNLLFGEIPSSLSRLMNLKDLDLSDNELSGNINLDSLPASLTSLDLRNNRLKGGISGLARFPNLSHLDLSHNELEGPIPCGIEVNLETVNLSSNHLVGAIPGGRWNASLVDLSDNDLTSSIPKGLLQNGAVERLRLGSNSLVGTIHIPPNSSFGDYLIELDVRNNRLSGNITSLLSQNLSAMRQLRLGRNMFALGNLQYEDLKSAMPLLEVLDLSQCKMEQEDFFPRYDPTDRRQVTPGSRLPFENMRSLDLSDNGLSGEFPSILAFFPLEELWLGAIASGVG